MSGIGLGSAICGNKMSCPSWQMAFAPSKSCLNNLILERGGRSGKGSFGFVYDLGILSLSSFDNSVAVLWVWYLGMISVQLLVEVTSLFDSAVELAVGIL